MKRSGRRRQPDSPARGGPEGRRTKFAVDAMHGSLARKLRAFGFDAAYYRRGGDAGFIELAASEGRVILSSDRLLVSKATSRGLPAVLLEGTTDGSRIREISAAAPGLGVTLRRGGPLCSLCGGELQSISRAEASGSVPPSVAGRHRLFFRCASCGHLYWHGGHWKKLMSLARRLDERQDATSGRSRKGRGRTGEKGHRGAHI